MRRDAQTWILASRLVENHGPDALHGARRAAETLWESDDTGFETPCRDIVRAMDFLLSEEGCGTIH